MQRTRLLSPKIKAFVCATHALSSSIIQMHFIITILYAMRDVTALTYFAGISSIRFVFNEFELFVIAVLVQSVCVCIFFFLSVQIIDEYYIHLQRQFI